MNDFNFEEFESISKYAQRVGLKPKAIQKRIQNGLFFQNGEVYQKPNRSYLIKKSASKREISAINNFKG